MTFDLSSILQPEHQFLSVDTRLNFASDRRRQVIDFIRDRSSVLSAVTLIRGTYVQNEIEVVDLKKPAGNVRGIVQNFLDTQNASVIPD